MTGAEDDPSDDDGERAAGPGELVIAKAPASTDAKDETEAVAAPGPRALRRPVLLVAAAALILTVALVGVLLARRQIDAEPAVAEETTGGGETAPAPDAVTLEMPTLQGGEPVDAAPPPPADKIFNSTNETLKEGAAAIARGADATPGAISELPPPPTGDFGNSALQDAAKDAAKSFLQKPEDDKSIDLSAPDRESALDSLERVAQSAGGDFTTPTAPRAGAQEAAGLNRALELQIADLNNSLGAAHQRTERQEGEIVRLNAELRRLKSGDAPAVALARLAEKLRRGEPYRSDLDAYAALAPDAALITEIEPHADKGVVTLAALTASFPDPRDRALDAARRAGATGPMALLAANFASLINLRPAGPKEGADAVAILSRAEAALSGGDLRAALSELSALDPAVAAPLGPWIVEARARVEAEAAISAALDGGGAASPGEPVY